MCMYVTHLICLWPIGIRDVLTVIVVPGAGREGGVGERQFECAVIMYLQWNPFLVDTMAPVILSSIHVARCPYV